MACRRLVAVGCPVSVEAVYQAEIVDGISKDQEERKGPFPATRVGRAVAQSSKKMEGVVQVLAAPMNLVV